MKPRVFLYGNINGVLTSYQILRQKSYGSLWCSEFILVSALHLQEEIKKKLKHCIAAFALSFF